MSRDNLVFGRYFRFWVVMQKVIQYFFNNFQHQQQTIMNQNSFDETLSLAPKRLEGCCIPQYIKKTDPATQSGTNKDRKRRLSLCLLSSMVDQKKQNQQVYKSVAQKFDNFGQRNKHGKNSVNPKIQIIDKRRNSLMLIKNSTNNNENNQNKQSVRKGLKVLMAAEMIKNQKPKLRQSNTPFRVNINRPSSNLEFYQKDYPLMYSKNQNSVTAQINQKAPFGINQKLMLLERNQATSNSSKLKGNLRSSFMFFNQIPNPTPSLKRYSYNKIPQFFPIPDSIIPENHTSIMSISHDIQNLSQILKPSKNNTQILSNCQKSYEPHLFQTIQFEKKEFYQTKRPQRKIQKFSQYFKRGGYRGSGRISSIYIVQQKELGFLFASKQVFKKTIYEKDMTSEMQRQIAIHYSLEVHENIVTLYQVLEDYQRYYFILELAESNLRNQMASAIDQKRAKIYLKDILRGLGFLHQNGIIHRHLKPENILVTNNCCKITDFGWTPKLLYMNNHSEVAEYCSPQVLNQQPYNYKADLWSVGVIAYELVTGLKPFSAFTEDYSIDFEKVCVSGCLKRVIEKLLQPEEDKRGTVQQILRMLQQ